MYYEEKVINGVLCYRHSPDDAWTEYGKEQLTEMIQNSRNECNLMKEKVNHYRNLHGMQ